MSQRLEHGALALILAIYKHIASRANTLSIILGIGPWFVERQTRTVELSEERLDHTTPFKKLSTIS